MKKRISIEQGIFISLIIFTIMAIFIPGKGPDSLIVALLSVATFLFGIFGAYILGDRNKRLVEIKETLRKDDSNFIDLYRLSVVFGKNVQKKIQKHIDNYFISTIDHKLIDYNLSAKYFLKLFDFVVKLKPKNEQQTEVYTNMINIIDQANENRKHLSVLIKNVMARFKWYTLIALWFVLMFSLFYINQNTFFSIVITILLSSVSVIFLLIVRDLDSLLWREQKWIWDPLDQVFRELNLLPYYGEIIIKSERTKLKKGSKIRVAHYPNKYPNFKGKKVKIVKI